MSALRPLEFLEVMPTEVGIAVEASVDPQTGSPSVRIPIPLTPGRDDFGPSLALVHGGYDPLAPFAFGWSLAGLPSVDVDTREGVPVYDSSEKVRFQGQELVPLEAPGRPSTFSRDEFDIVCFRPRVEREPLRAERWTHRSTRRTHWRVRRGDGSVWIFGRRLDSESRVANPERPEETFRWLLESAHDRLGNAIVVRYQAEDLAGFAAPDHEVTRFASATANRYPKRILYGNAAPLGEDDAELLAWHFELVLDYGDHDASPTPEPTRPWSDRRDIGTTARPGFVVRTRRLCERLLMFHRFPDELGEEATLVSSVELGHALQGSISVLRSVRRVGHGAEARATPAASLYYTGRDGGDAVDRQPVPLLGAPTELIDLYGEGLPGLLTRDASGVRYARNLGGGRFGGHVLLPEWPVGLDEGTLGDFDGDGHTELVQATGPSAGFYRLDRRSGRWTQLQRFDAHLSLTASTGLVRHLDLSGNGLPDLVVLHRWGLTFLPNLGLDGFGAPVEVRLTAAQLPAVDLPLDRFLADMTGDGLADVVEVLNGAVRYWPNLGRGRFGAPITMDGAPHLERRGAFDAARVLQIGRAHV